MHKTLVNTQLAGDAGHNVLTQDSALKMCLLFDMKLNSIAKGNLVAYKEQFGMTVYQLLISATPQISSLI